jgi:protein ImuB
MGLADARSAFPPDAVRVVADDPARTERALSALARWAHRFSPRVAIDPPDGLLLDITGCERALGGELAIRDDALDRLGRMGVKARCVIAPTFAAAGALARAGGPGIVESTGLRGAIDPLPVCVLGLDTRQTAGLVEVGIERLGQLIDMPRSVMPARFGHDLLLRLDRMLGRAIDTIEPIRPEEPRRACVSFDGPTHRWESIEHVIRSLLDDLCAGLSASDLGVLRLVLTMPRSDLPPARLAFAVSRPTHDARHLWALIHPRLERTHLGFGIEGVDLLAERCDRIAHRQTNAWGADEDGVDNQEGAARMIDALSNRIGRERVLRAYLVESYRPERSIEHHPASDGAAETDRPVGLVLAPGYRPTLLLDTPEPAEVLALTPDGPVHRLAWRGDVAGVLTCIGPERVGPEWWRVSREHARTRDYFSLQEETGRWVWLFRELETGRWFVHGIWA